MTHEQRTHRSRWLRTGAATLAAVGMTAHTVPTLAQFQVSGGSPRVYSHHPLNYFEATNAVEVVRGADGHIYHLTTGAVGWATTDVTGLTNTPLAIGNPRPFYHDNAHVIVYKGGSAGHIYELYAYGSPHSDPVLPWHAANLSALANAPSAFGEPSGYVRSDGVAAVVYRGIGNHVYELFLLPDGKWRVGNLTALTNAPLAAGDPIGYKRFDGVNAVLYRATSGHLYELSLGPGGGWVRNNLTSITGAPTAVGSPAPYHRTDGAAVVYRSGAGHILELFLPKTGGAWIANDLTALASAPVTAGNPSGYLRPPRWVEPPYTNYRVPSVVYRGVNGQVYELFLDIDAVWKIGDLTAITNAVSASQDPIGYPNGDVAANVIYRGSNGRLQRIYMDGWIPGTWRTEQLFPFPNTP